MGFADDVIKMEARSGAGYVRLETLAYEVRIFGRIIRVGDETSTDHLI